MSPKVKAKRNQNSREDLIRTERLPHIWCPGCGIGIAMGAFIRAVESTRIDPDLISVVSGIGCTARVAGYLRLDSFHTGKHCTEKTMCKPNSPWPLPVWV